MYMAASLAMTYFCADIGHMYRTNTMKIISFFLTLGCSIGSLWAQIPSDCTVPNALYSTYERDLTQLATARLFETESADTALVRIPQAVIDSIAEGMAAIINSAIPEKDSVFNIHCLHNVNGWPGPYGGFLVKVDTAYAWTAAWQNVQTMTGDANIDSMLVNYRLNVSDFYHWSIGNYANLVVDGSWNILALMDSIGMIDGVIQVEPNSILGGAGFFDYNVVGNWRYYDFTLEWMDCFDGCDARKTWQFRVNDACMVEYLGFEQYCLFGPSCDELPAPTNCNIFTSMPEVALPIQVYSIYPNPCASHMLLRSEPGLKNATLLIFNMQGQLQMQWQHLHGQAIDLNTDKLPSGLYTLHVQQEGARFYQQKLAVAR